MSHTLNPQDISLNLKAVVKLFGKLPPHMAGWKLISQHDTVTFHDGQSHTGMVITAPDWKFPIVIDDDGHLHYDIYGYDLSQSEVEQRAATRQQIELGTWTPVWGFPGDVAKLVSTAMAVELKYNPAKVKIVEDETTHEVEYVFA